MWNPVNKSIIHILKKKKNYQNQIIIVFVNCYYKIFKIKKKVNIYYVKINSNI